MLRALGSPTAFVGLLVGFLLALLVQAYAQAFTARMLGDRWAVRRLGGFRRILDPFGAVAGAIGGPGWGAAPEIPLRSKGRLAIAVLAGPAAVLLVGIILLLAYAGIGGPHLGSIGVGDVLDFGGRTGLPAGEAFLLCAGLEMLAMAVLALVPLPPLPGWRLLELASTGSHGWQRARHYLVDVNLGVLALLVLLILPLGASKPLLLILTDTAAGSLLDAIV